MAAKSRELPRPFTMPWGRGEIVEEVTAVGEWHEPSIQLLRYEDGSESIRFCHYDHRGRFQRSPLIVNRALLTQLGRGLASSPRLRAHLGRLLAPRTRAPKRR